MASMQVQVRHSRFPGIGLVAGFGQAAPAGLLIERPAGADVIGGFIDRAVERRVARQPEHTVNGVVLPPRHDLGSAVITVTPDGDACGGPVLADAPDQAPQTATDLLARGASCPNAG